MNKLIILFVAACSALAAVAADKGLRVYWADVEGGAGTLIVTPAGESILVDTGMPGGRDPGRIVKAAKESAGVEKIDFLVMSHFHIDHFGGAAEIAQAMPVGQVYDNGIPDQNPDNNPRDTRFVLQVKPYRDMKVGGRNVIKPGDTLPLKQAAGPQVKIQCLAAKQQVYRDPAALQKANDLCTQVTQHPKDMSDNANSIVLLVSYGDFQFFIGGDLTWNVEAQLVCPQNIVGQVDVYQVTHHGMDTSNNSVLVKSLEPRVAVMSNGTRKGCGPETFKTLSSTPSVEAVFQIHKNLRDDGATVNTKPELIANHDEKCAGHHIEMAVTPDAKNYTIKIPATGLSKTYATK